MQRNCKRREIGSDNYSISNKGPDPLCSPDAGPLSADWYCLLFFKICWVHYSCQNVFWVLVNTWSKHIYIVSICLLRYSFDLWFICDFFDLCALGQPWFSTFGSNRIGRFSKVSKDLLSTVLFKIRNKVRIKFKVLSSPMNNVKPCPLKLMLFVNLDIFL